LLQEITEDRRQLSRISKESQDNCKTIRDHHEIMDNGHNNFWQLIKEIAGLDVEESGATPDVDGL